MKFKSNPNQIKSMNRNQLQIKSILSEYQIQVESKSTSNQIQIKFQSNPNYSQINFNFKLKPYPTQIGMISKSNPNNVHIKSIPNLLEVMSALCLKSKTFYFRQSKPYLNLT